MNSFLVDHDKDAKNPKEPYRFLEQTEPVSRVFGLDRGTPIDRYYIDSFLKEESRKITDRQITMEVGENLYSRRFFPKSIHNVLDYNKGMDLTKSETIGANCCDVFICTQTFNFIYDVKKAIRGSFEVLKPEGTLLATVAGNISQVSKYDMDRWGDYWRFTDQSIKMLMQEVFGNKVCVFPYGNSMAATAFIQGLCVEEVNRDLLDVSDPEYSIVIGIVAKKQV